MSVKEIHNRLEQGTDHILWHVLEPRGKPDREMYRIHGYDRHPHLGS